MLLYYHSWMFYNHFIMILYHFLVLTYWHSAKCQLLFSACFLHRRKSIPNGVQTQQNFLWIFWTRRHPVGERSIKEEAWGEHKTPGPGGPDAPWWVVPTSGATRTASLLYKYPNIPKPLGESTKINSSRRKFQTTKSNLDTITKGFIRSIGASPMMRE